MNDVEINAGGRLQLTAAEAIDMRAPKIYIEADEELHMTADTFARMEYQKLDMLIHDLTTITSENSIDISTNNNIHIAAKNDVHTKAGANVSIEAARTISNHADTHTTNTSSAINLTTSGTTNMKSGGNLVGDAAMVYFQSGASSAVSALPTTNPVAAVEADYSNAGLLDGREDFVNLVMDDVFPDNFIDESAYTSDDVGQEKVSKDIQDDLIKNGLSKKSDFDEQPVDADTDTSNATSSLQHIEPDKKLLGLTSVPPDNFALSPHFTLGMLSSKAPAQPNKVKAQKGLSIGQIVYNLADVALNVLEPLYAVYPSLVVTSGFRNEEASKNAGSVHPYGLAVDIQFGKIPKSEYYGIAKKIKNLLSGYDQLLLEYRTTGNATAWIHIGIKNQSGQQRNQVATFFNHSKYSDGLTQLAADNRTSTTA
jgi:hypothetical protein